MRARDGTQAARLPGAVPPDSRREGPPGVWRNARFEQAPPSRPTLKPRLNDAQTAYKRRTSAPASRNKLARTASNGSQPPCSQT